MHLSLHTYPLAKTPATFLFSLSQRKKKRAEGTRRFSRWSLGMAYYHRLLAKGVEEKYARRYVMDRYDIDPWDYLR